MDRGAPRSELPAKTVLIAAGTQPNTVLAREDAANFRLDGRYFQAYDEAGNPVTPERAIAKPTEVRVLLSRRPDGRFMSYFGDVHPSYFGNVVKAIGSAKQGYPVVSRVLGAMPPASALSDAEFMARLNDELRATVHEVIRLDADDRRSGGARAARRAPLPAGAVLSPAEFRDRSRRMPTGTRLAMEGIALTGAWVDRERGLISTIVLEMGGSSDLCLVLKPGEPVVLMGPTGTPTEIPANETVVLAGGGLGNAVLFSIGQAMRAAGNRVLYFAGYKHMMDRYKISEIEAASDAVVWCCDEEPGFTPERPQDKSFVGNIVQGDARLRERRAGRAAYPVFGRRPHHRDRLGPDDGGRGTSAQGPARALPQAAAHRARLHQFTDAMHDEGDLRAVPAAARRSGDGEGELRVLVLQPGPIARSASISRRWMRG